MTRPADRPPSPRLTPPSPPLRTAVLNLVRRAARAEILPRFRALDPAAIAQKSGPQDLVTEADTAAEAMITRGLRQMFPDALIVGEEATAADPGLPGRIDAAPLAFTVDPVDGTWNFATGLATFGVILSMTRFGTPVFGMLYDPLMDDCIVAAAGEPAQFLHPRRPPRPLSVSGGGSVADLTGYMPLYVLPPEQRGPVASLFPRFRRVMNLRCSCHEFRSFAQGHVDFVLSAALTPWDHAAGALIGARAGGHVAMLDGSDYRAGRREGLLLAASTPETWEQVRALLDEALA